MFHLRQQDRRINDPNGPCYWNGRYHLFFQHRDEMAWAWGHAVSTDLLNWERLPDALLPAFRSKRGHSGYSGAESCWSGGICIDGKQAVAVFYGHGSPDTCGLYVMTSSDPMLCHWENITDGPVIRSIDQPNEGGDLNNHSPYDSLPYCQAPMLYDPYIWYEDGVYHLLSGGVQRDKYTGGFRRQEYLYTSTDLINWAFSNPLVTNDSYQDIADDGACPYFLPWKDGKTEGDEHRLLLHYSHQYGPRYVMGVYDKKEKVFTPYSGSRVSTNTKRDSYEAPALFANTPDGAMLATYIMHGRGIPSVMSMVHRLERCGERLEEIAVSPAADIDAFPYTRKAIRGEEKFIKTNEETTILRMRISYDQKVAYPVIRFCRENGEVFGSLRLHVGFGGRKKRNNLNYYSDIVSLVMEDRTDSSAPMTVQLPPTNGIWELILVLDGDTLEVFFPDALSIGRRIYGELKGMYLRLDGGEFIGENI